MELLEFLIQWGTNIIAASVVGITIFGFAGVLKRYVSRKSVSK